MWPNPDDPYEPYWLDEDAEKAVAFVHAQSEVCQRCGTREADWVDQDGYPLSPPLYEGGTMRCHGCMHIEEAQDTIPDGQKGVRAILKRHTPTA